MRFWDTSALLKLYAFEPDAAYFLNLVANDARPLLTADIAREEMLCALYRKELSGDVKPGEARVLFNRFLEDERNGRIIVIPNGQDVLAEAERLVKRCYAQTPPLTVRSLDVIHVASALVSKADAVVATDARLRDAAGVMGLNVLP
ncbi:hypothetical protein BH24DEI2_BH24DEI2_07950 [soil metagenome]